MKFKKRLSIMLVAIIFTTCIFCNCKTVNANEELPSRKKVLSEIRKINDYWISTNPDPGNYDWNRAVYFTGNMAAYSSTNEQKYLDYAIKWAEQNNWKSISTDHADYQICFQTYIDLYNICPEKADIKSSFQVMDEVVNSSRVDYWSWIDAFFMAGPTLAKMTKMTKNQKYSKKLYAMYRDMKANRGLYDKTEGLWYRDNRYIYPTAVSRNDKKVFWGRGNGWVIAGLAKILSEIPSDPHKEEYIKDFQTMAAALKKIQGSDGFWRKSLLDSDEFPDPETSCTGLITYALAWGINNEILDSNTYLPVVIKSWNGLQKEAIQESGFVGWVQGISDSPGASSHSSLNTSDFGVGVVLLACSEIEKLSSDDLSSELSDTIALYIGNSNAYIKNRKTKIDSNNHLIVPYKKGNRTFVPLRFIAESIGADVYWGEEESLCTIVYKSKVLEIRPETSQYTLDGESRNFDIPVQEYNNSIFVPIRAIAEIFDKKVFWDERGLILLSDYEIIVNSDKDKSVIDQLITTLQKEN